MTDAGKSPRAEKEEFREGPWSYVVAEGDGGASSGGPCAVVTGCAGEPRELVLPETLGSLPVLAVGARAFQGRRLVRSVSIPDGVESIGAYAFAQSGLTHVELPSSVSRVGEWAFFRCRSLSSVRFSEGLLSLGRGAFAGDPLGKVRLPASLERIEGRVFSSSASGGSARFDLSVSEGNPAFSSEAGSLYEWREDGLRLRWHFAREKRCEVVRGCESIAASAFEGDTRIEEVVLPKTLRRIGKRAFAGCVRLGRADLPVSLVSVGEEAFRSTSLAAIELGPRVERVGPRAFAAVGPAARPGDGAGGAVSLAVDAANPRFSAREGLLLESADDGVHLVGCFGPHPRLSLPEEVTHVEGLCFFHAGVEELRLHARLASMAPDAFEGLDALRRLVAEAPDAEGGSVELVFPGGDASAEGASRCIRLGDDGCLLDAAAYDGWALEYAASAGERLGFARMALGRLERPWRLSPEAEEGYLAALRGGAEETCLALVASHDFGPVETLAARGLLSSSIIERASREARERADAEATAFLLELERSRFGFSKPDLSL